MNNLTATNPTFKTISQDGDTWLTASEIAKALGYADKRSVSRLYSRNSQEFTASMHSWVSLATSDGPRQTAVFSLRGAHLLAMFAKTAKAKTFRRAVLDLIEQDHIASRYTAAQAANIKVMAQNIEEARALLIPLLQANNAARDAITAERQAMARIHDFVIDANLCAKSIKGVA